MNHWRLLLCLLAVGLCALLAALALDYRRYALSPMALAQEELWTVSKGQTQTALLAQWQAQGWLNQHRDVYWLRLEQKFQQRSAHLILGEYRLRPGLSLRAQLSSLHQGDVLLRQFTIPEGWNFRELRLALAQEASLKPRSKAMSDQEIMQAIGRPDVHPEGRFLPETYAYVGGSSDLDVLRRAAEAMEKTLAEVWAKRQPQAPLSSPEEALILASIIEKETAVPSERPRIAGVFAERLKIGMRLQTDPTVIYGMGERFDGNIRRRDLRQDTPYNTYTRAGLPPTPIAMPGRAALEAAVAPEMNGELYFVSKGDGSHYFSRTLSEHQRAVRKYQLK